MLNTSGFRKLPLKKILKTRIILGAIAVMVVTTSAVFAAFLFTQTFPPVTRPSGLLANCTTLSVDGAIPVVGTTGFIQLDCGGGVAAFSTSATVTPTFTLPAGYTSLQYVPADGTFACGTYSGPVTSGNPVTFGVGSFDYCISVDSDTLVLATFDISWAT